MEAGSKETKAGKHPAIPGFFLRVLLSSTFSFY